MERILSFSFLSKREYLFIFRTENNNLKKRQQANIFSHHWRSQIIKLGGYRGWNTERDANWDPLDRQPGHLGKWGAGSSNQDSKNLIYPPGLSLLQTHHDCVKPSVEGARGCCPHHYVEENGGWSYRENSSLGKNGTGN